MPATNRPSRAINLLPGQKLDDTNGGKVLRWLLSTFRVIVVLVQIVVILAFAGRVFIDARLSSLNREIEEKYALVQSYQNIETTFRRTQLKLDTFASLRQSSNSYLSLLQAVAGQIPTNVQLISMEKNGDLLVITARTTEESAILTFASRINNIETVTNAQVVEIRQDTTTNLFSEFTIHANVEALVNNVS